MIRRGSIPVSSYMNLVLFCAGGLTRLARTSLGRQREAGTSA
jgi:hypothetical protein